MPSLHPEFQIEQPNALRVSRAAISPKSASTQDTTQKPISRTVTGRGSGVGLHALVRPPTFRSPRRLPRSEQWLARSWLEALWLCKRLRCCKVVVQRGIDLLHAFKRTWALEIRLKHQGIVGEWLRIRIE